MSTRLHPCCSRNKMRTGKMASYASHRWTLLTLLWKSPSRTWRSPGVALTTWRTDSWRELWTPKGLIPWIESMNHSLTSTVLPLMDSWAIHQIKHYQLQSSKWLAFPWIVCQQWWRRKNHSAKATWLPRLCHSISQTIRQVAIGWGRSIALGSSPRMSSQMYSKSMETPM